MNERVGSPLELAEELAGLTHALAEVVDSSTIYPKDSYAQAISYGLFAVRLQTDAPFTLQRAIESTPLSVSILHEEYVRIQALAASEALRVCTERIVELLAAVNPSILFAQWHREQVEPLTHFYELFLAAYSSRERKAKGVWYTPQSIVSFMVRAVGDIVGDGEAQYLDPAMGTGSFLLEVLRQGKKRGVSSARITVCGREIMLAPYVATQLNLAKPLEASGYSVDIQLGDALAEPVRMPSSGYRVVLGNPPYNMHSGSTSPWFAELLSDYYYEPGGATRLRERNTKTLRDDYVKFIRLGEQLVAEGQGVLAYVCPHGFLDNPSFRGMRWHLLQSFDTLYVLDLHGNARRRERGVSGGVDENVFRIMQGVCIAIFVRHSRTRSTTRPLAKVFHHHLYGKRVDKLAFLDAHALQTIPWTALQPRAPYYYFIPKNLDSIGEYERGFSLAELFLNYSVGVVTSKDSLLVRDSPDEMQEFVEDTAYLTPKAWEARYGEQDSKAWTLARAKADIGQSVDTEKIHPYAYRPFDTRYVYYTGKSNGIISRPRYKSLKDMPQGENLSLITMRINPESIEGTDFDGIFCADILPDMHLIGSQSYAFPLYYWENSIRHYNLNGEILKELETRLGTKVLPEELVAYIYAVLHSPAYRQEYRELLKSDFPHLPFPIDLEKYRHLVRIGRQLMTLHLMRQKDCWEVQTAVHGQGAGVVVRPKFKSGCVYINPKQYIAPVSRAVWEYRVGGYRPAQKWLKSRRGKMLTPTELQHYQLILYVLAETLRLMREI